MDNILTAKEWLEQEFGLSELKTITTLSNPVPIMERYASYKTKVLEEEFSKYWKETTMKILELEGKLQFIENCNKHFNITTEK